MPLQGQCGKDACNYLRVLWPTSTILRLYAHCCSADLRFFSAGHFLALPSISRLCRVFFLLCQAFFSYAEPFSTLPSIFLPCWLLVSFAKHLSSVLSTSQLSRAFFGHAKHFSVLPIISLLCGDVFRLFQAYFRYAGHFFLLCQAYLGYAEHFSTLPSVCLLC